MARPRSLHPSPAALAMRARRSLAGSSGPPTVELVEAALASAPDCPVIPGAATTEEAVRLKAVYDARRSRLASEVEALRLELDRGRTITRERHRESVTIIVEAILSHINAVADAAVDTHPPTDQPAVRHKLAVAVLKLREAARVTIRGGK